MFCCNSTLRDTPTLVSPSGDNCVRRWKGGEGWRESTSRLDLAGEAFLSPVQPSMSELQPEAAVSRSEGFYSCAGPELCVIQKLSKTMAIPLGKSSFFRLCLTIHYWTVS